MQSVHELPTPEAVRAERCCLALALADWRTRPEDLKARAKVLDRLDADWLTSKLRRRILVGIRELVARGVTPGLAEVVDHLEPEPDNLAPELFEELTRCVTVDAVPVPGDVDHWLGRVADAATRRLLADRSLALREAVASGEDTGGILRDAAANLEAAQKIAAGRVNQPAVGARETMAEVLDQIEAASEGKGLGLATGLRDLDRVMAGMRAGDLIVAAGRPGMGKSALAGWISTRVAESGVPVAMVSLEMPRAQIQTRMLAAESRVPLRDLRTAQLTQRHWEDIAAAASQIQALPIWYLDRGRMQWHSIETRLRMLHAEQGIGFAVIDYLQIIDSGRRAENRTQDVSYLSRSCKTLAMELGIPILVLSQLSRSVESRSDKRPQLSDLRESGAIEQDADAVWLLYREDYYRQDCEPEIKGILEVNVAKQRNGDTETVSVRWRRFCMAFSDLEESPERGYRRDVEG